MRCSHSISDREEAWPREAQALRPTHSAGAGQSLRASCSQGPAWAEPQPPTRGRRGSVENDFEMAPKNEQDSDVWKADASSGGVGTVWKQIWAGTHVGAIEESECHCGCCVSSRRRAGGGGPVKVLMRGIEGSGLSWQWSKWGDERAAGAEVGDFCVSSGEAGRGERRCVGQRVVGLGGIKKKMTEMSAGRMVGLFIEMGKSQREGALGGGGRDRKES